jgi:hypothetical protein
LIPPAYRLPPGVETGGISSGRTCVDPVQASLGHRPRQNQTRSQSGNCRPPSRFFQNRTPGGSVRNPATIVIPLMRGHCRRVLFRRRSMPRTPDQGRRAPFRRPKISFSQGAMWNAAISKYIGIIPLSSDASCAAEQSTSRGPRTPISTAMIAKVGAAARHSQSATRLA